MAVNASSAILNHFVPPFAICGKLEEGNVLVYNASLNAFVNKGAPKDAGTGENYRIAENGEMVWINRRYFVNRSYMLYLPDLSQVEVGEAVTISVGVGVAPKLTSFGAQAIMYNEIMSRSYVELAGIDSEINVVADGNRWILLAEQEVHGGSF